MNNFTFSQPLLIPEPAADYAMYFRGGVLKDNGIFVQAGDTLSSETYFNMFSKKYAKYTTLSDIQVRLTVKGQFEYAFHEDYFTLTAVTDCVLRGGEYYSDAPCANDVRLYVGICTFRREEFIAEKIKMFERFSWDKLSPTVGRVKVFIADNGGTIPQTVNENISVIYGPNDGGSGGFGRTLLAAKKYAEGNTGTLDYMLYTDDDAEYTADSVMRLLMFLSYLRPEYHSAMVGGAMLFNDKPNTIWANGEQLTKTNIKFNKRGLDLTDIPQLREADTEIVGDNQYLGWWFCAFPLRYGQPLPFFFQYDDIEFSLRYKDAAKITLPGICALHENFEKRYNNTREYYALRNRLFTCSAHLKYTRFDAILALGYVVARNLLCFRYKNVDLALRASRDFRKGLPALYRVDAEALHNEIRAYAYKDEGVLVPVHEQEKIRDIMERGYADVNYKTKTMRNLWRLFVPGRGQCYAPAGRPLYVASEKSAIIVNFEPETGVSYVTKKQISQNLVGIIRYCGEAICILCGYHRTNSRKK